MLNYEFPPLGGGAGNANYYLLKEFSKHKDIRIDLVTSSVGKYKKEKFSEKITVHYLDIGKKNKNFYYQTSRDLIVYSIKAFYYAWRLRLKNDYDLVHAFFGIPCGLIAMLLFKPYIVSLRGSDVPFHNPRFKFIDRYVFRYLSALVWTRAKKVVVNSADLKKTALNTAARVKFEIIPNGVDIDFYKPDSRLKKKNAILFVGRLAEIKRIDFLIRSFSGLSNEIKRNWELWIVGEGPKRAELEALSARLKIRDKVVFFGNKKKTALRRIYQQAGIYALVSLREGMSNTLLEAMASGLPVVVTRSAAGDLATNKEGLVLSSFDSRKFTLALERLLRSKLSRQAKGDMSRNKVGFYSWESVAKRYINLYEGLTKTLDAFEVRRVLMLNYEFPPLGGGTANANYYLLKEYAKRSDLKLDLITGSSGRYKVNKFSKNITIHYLNIYKNNKNLHYQSYKDLLVYSIKSLIYAWKLRLRNKYDLVHSFYGIPCAFVAMLLFKPYIVSLRGSDVPFYNKRFKFLDKYVFVYLSKFVWSRARHVIANSKDLKNLAQKTAPNIDIKIIPNGVDTNFFKSNKKIKKENAILFVGRLIERKRADWLISAFARLPKEVQKRWKVWIVGEGPEKRKLERLANDSAVSERIIFLGYQDKQSLKKVYQQAMLYVLSSKNEGMSNTFLEAMASGLPVILSATGGAKEIVSGNGVIIKDIKDMASAILRLAKNSDLRAEMSKKSELISKNLSWNSVALKYQAYY